MRYYIIINPPQYRDNDEDHAGYAWAGEAEDEADAFKQACDACEADNKWGSHDEDPEMAEHTAIDREDTDVIECGPDYKFMVERVREIVAKTRDKSPGDTNWLLLQAIYDTVTV